MTWMEQNEVRECPQCHGMGWEVHVKNKCSVCRGEKKIEVTFLGGSITAPAGSFFPTGRRGMSGWYQVLFGPPKQERSR